MLSALGWGALAAVSLALGAALALVRSWRTGIPGGVLAFGAGALLVMLVDSMTPEAKAKAGNRAGLVTVLGFAVAAALSNLT